ncbi:MAG: hypothetical protein H6R18_1912 [Proteobacteria bacterium]|nr:hypothetical protein [Pseudomonadota bacterium]
MSTLRQESTEDQKLAPIGVIKETLEGLQDDAVAFELELNRLAVRLHYMLEKASICMNNLERHCGH